MAATIKKNNKLLYKYCHRYLSTEILSVFFFVLLLLHQHLLVAQFKAGGQPVDGFLPGRVFGWWRDDVVVSQVQGERTEI